MDHRVAVFDEFNAELRSFELSSHDLDPPADDG
jgi:hypothetical protein